MTREVVSNLPMDRDFTSDWISSIMTDFAGHNKASIGNVQIIWQGVSFNPDAVVKIEITNDLQYKTVLGTYNINNTDNSEDTLMIDLTTGFGFIRFVYTANNVSAGLLNININYE